MIPYQPLLHLAMLGLFLIAVVLSGDGRRLMGGKDSPRLRAAKRAHLYLFLWVASATVMLAFLMGRARLSQNPEPQPAISRKPGETVRVGRPLITVACRTWRRPVAVRTGIDAEALIETCPDERVAIQLEAGLMVTVFYVEKERI